MYMIPCVLISLKLFHIAYAGAGYFQLNVVGKDTKQSSTDEGGVSSRAVDGDSNNSGDGACSQTNVNDPYTWWAVDLGANYRVHSVGIVNRRDCCEHRLNNVTIFGYNDTFNPAKNNDKETCYTLTDNFGKGRTRNFTCAAIMNTKFVGIMRTVRWRLALCEVYIYVACPDGTFGEGCKQTCSEHCQQAPCDRETGTCPNLLCKPGYHGDRCDADCEPHTYGENCAHNCSQKCTSYCDRFDGSCPGGECLPGYKGYNCTEECPPGTFGLGCVSTCFPNCLSACDPVDGICREGCQEGWSGRHCDITLKGPSSTAFVAPIIILSIMCAGLIIAIIVIHIKQKQRDGNNASHPDQNTFGPRHPYVNGDVQPNTDERQEATSNAQEYLQLEANHSQPCQNQPYQNLYM